MKRKIIFLLVAAIFSFSLTSCVELTIGVVGAIIEASVTNSMKNSTEKNDTPQLTKPSVTISLSEESPESSIIIEWTTSTAKNVEYEVFRSFVTNGQSVTESIYSTYNDEVTKYTDRDLESNTQYTYVVTACREGSVTNGYYRPETQTSLPVSLTTQKDVKQALETPNNIRLTVAAPHSLTLSWDAVPDATSYHVYFKDGLITKTSSYKNTTSTSICFDHLNGSEVYTYKVQAWNEKGEYSKISGYVSETTTEPDNTTKEKAYTLLAGTEEEFHNETHGEYWFHCTPEYGTIDVERLNYKDNTPEYSVYKKDGTVIAENVSNGYDDFVIEGFIPNTEIYILVKGSSISIQVQ